jgi:hypothetical protein
MNWGTLTCGRIYVKCHRPSLKCRTFFRVNLLVGVDPVSELQLDPVFGHPLSELNVLFKISPVSGVDPVFRVVRVSGVTHNFKINPDLFETVEVTSLHDSLRRVPIPVSNREAMHGVGNKRHHCFIFLFFFYFFFRTSVQRVGASRPAKRRLKCNSSDPPFRKPAQTLAAQRIYKCASLQWVSRFAFV